MNRENLISCIQLINTPGIGPIGFRKLLRQFGSAENALSALSRKKEVFSRRKAEEEIMTAELKHVEIITAEDEAYPYNLKQIEDFPPILYAKGNIELLKNDNMLAVVGSRSASLSALKLAGRIAADIARKDVVVVSGMARGIDAAAHQGALEADGGTIAVLGTGIDVVYPLENEKLYNKLVQNGLVLTEYPFHTKPQATNFPRRNRIVSGLSKGVLVIEAGVRSGSLITAHQALEQGRDVYAVPGAPYDGRASGCNKLLKEGAILVDDADDVLDNFDFSPVTFAPRHVKEPETHELLYSTKLEPAHNESKQKEYYSPLKTLEKFAENTLDAPQKGLTERQIDIVKCIAEGLSNKQIAYKLHLKEGTIKVHITIILKVLNVKNRTSAVIEAAKRGYISDNMSDNG